MKLGASKLKSRSMVAAGSNGRKRPYGMMLLLATMAALLSVVMLHKLRERRVFDILLNERESQLLSLQLLIQKEREHSKELKRRLDDMKSKSFSLRTRNMDLINKLIETEATTSYLKEKQREIEMALTDKQNQINEETESINANLRVAALADLLKQREGELEELKQRLSRPENTTTAENVDAGNGTGGTNREDNGTSQNKQVEEVVDSEAIATMEVNNSADMELKNLGDGQLVKLKTNIGKQGLKQENQGIEALTDTESEKPVISQESEHREGGENGQESTLEVTREEGSKKVEAAADQQPEKPTESQVSEHREGGENDQGSTPEVTKVEASENQQPEEVTVSQESEHHEGGETSQESTPEVTKKEDPKRAEALAAQQTETLAVSQGVENGQESVTKEEDSRKVEVSADEQPEKLAVSQEGEHNEGSENGEEGTPEVTKEEDSKRVDALADQQPQKLAVSLESEHREGNENGEESTPEVTKEEDSEKVVNSQNGISKHEDQETRVEHGNRKRTRRNRRHRLGRKVDLVKKSNEHSENPKNGENNSHEKKGDAAVDSTSVEKHDEEAIEETTAANTTSRPEQTEASSIVEDDKNQMPGDKTGEADKFSIHETKDDHKEAAENAENSNSDNVSEF